MGQQQILLIVLSVILVGIAVSVGITMFHSYAVMSNQDAIMLDIINISNLAHQHKIRPSALGGGSGSFERFEDNLAASFKDNDNATYEIVVLEHDGNGSGKLRVEATSKSYDAKIIAEFDLNLQIIEPADVSDDETVRNGYLFIGWDN